jgi:hypothetical protein
MSVNEVWRAAKDGKLEDIKRAVTKDNLAEYVEYPKSFYHLLE